MKLYVPYLLRRANSVHLPNGRLLDLWWFPIRSRLQPYGLQTAYGWCFPRVSWCVYRVLVKVNMVRTVKSTRLVQTCHWQRGTFSPLVCWSVGGSQLVVLILRYDGVAKYSLTPTQQQAQQRLQHY